MTRSILPWIAAAALVAAAAAPGAAPSRPVRPIVSLSATPAHLTLLGRSPQTLVVHNDGSARVRVFPSRAAFAFDLYGNADLSPGPAPRRSARTWLVVRPRRLVLAPGKEGIFRIAAHPPPDASAGDHHALVLLSARAPGRARVSIRTRLGVLVFVRVPGLISRHVVIGRVRVVRTGRRRSIAVTTINRGNVAERLLPGQVTVALHQGRRAVAFLRGRARDLLPHTRGLVLVPVRSSLRGRFVAVVRVAAQPGWTAGPSAPRLPSAKKAFSLRL